MWHLRNFLRFVVVVVLEDAKGVNPDQVNVELAAGYHRIPNRLRE
jgi:hypothetical protein